jgi:hypothetical protein
MPIGQLQKQHRYKETTNKQKQNKSKARTADEKEEALH